MHEESFLGSGLREDWKSKTKEDKEVRALTFLAEGKFRSVIRSVVLLMSRVCGWFLM